MYTSSRVFARADYLDLAMRLDEILLCYEGPSSIATLDFEGLGSQRSVDIKWPKE